MQPLGAIRYGSQTSQTNLSRRNEEVARFLKGLSGQYTYHSNTGLSEIKQAIRDYASNSSPVNKRALIDTLKRYQKDNPKSFQGNTQKLYILLEQLEFKTSELKDLGIVNNKLETAKLTRKGPKETERAIQRYLVDSSPGNLKAAKEMLFAYQKKHPNNCAINRGHFKQLVEGTELEAFLLPVKLPGTTKVGSIGTSTRSCEKAIKDFYSGNKTFDKVLSTFKTAKEEHPNEFGKRKDEYRTILSQLLTTETREKEFCEQLLEIQSITQGHTMTKAVQDLADTKLKTYYESNPNGISLKYFGIGSLATLALQKENLEKRMGVETAEHILKEQSKVNKKNDEKLKDLITKNKTKNPAELKEHFTELLSSTNTPSPDSTSTFPIEFLTNHHEFRNYIRENEPQDVPASMVSNGYLGDYEVPGVDKSKEKEAYHAEHTAKQVEKENALVVYVMSSQKDSIKTKCESAIDFTAGTDDDKKLDLCIDCIKYNLKREAAITKLEEFCKTASNENLDKIIECVLTQTDLMTEKFQTALFENTSISDNQKAKFWIAKQNTEDKFDSEKFKTEFKKYFKHATLDQTNKTDLSSFLENQAQKEHPDEEGWQNNDVYQQEAVVKNHIRDKWVKELLRDLNETET